MTADFLAPIAMLAPRDFGGAAGLVATANSVPNFSMRCQEEDQWCWAAVTQSVEAWKGVSFDQSDVASMHVGPNLVPLACIYPLATGDSHKKCVGCGGQGCAEPHSLGIVLTERGRIAGNGSAAGPVTFAAIQTAISAHKPLPVRINWGGSAHFVAVTAYYDDAAGAPWVTVLDPLVPYKGALATDERDMRYNTFHNAYPSTAGATGTPDYRYELK